MLIPKRVKHRKVQRGSMKGKAKGGTKLNFGDWGIQALEAAWCDVVPCEMCGTLDVAVESAARAAKEGDCILLSPGAASFDQFKSYGERGDRFSALVKEYA